jgi:hypothetical protein
MRIAVYRFRCRTMRKVTVLNNMIKAVAVVVAAFVVVIAMTRPPSLSMIVKPDPRDPQNVGIGLQVKGKIGARSAPLQATVRIKKPDGEVLHSKTDLLQNFAFG